MYNKCLSLYIRSESYLETKDILQTKKPILLQVRSSHKNNISVILISRLIDSKSLEKHQKFLLENETQKENTKKKLCFALAFLCDLTLITHNAPYSVNSSVRKVLKSSINYYD